MRTFSVSTFADRHMGGAVGACVERTFSQSSDILDAARACRFRRDDERLQGLADLVPDGCLVAVEFRYVLSCCVCTWWFARCPVGRGYLPDLFLVLEMKTEETLGSVSFGMKFLEHDLACTNLLEPRVCFSVRIKL